MSLSRAPRGAAVAQGTWSPQTRHVQQLGAGAAPRPFLSTPTHKSYRRSVCGRGWGTCRGPGQQCRGKAEMAHWTVAQPWRTCPGCRCLQGTARDGSRPTPLPLRPGPARPPPGTLCPLLPQKVRRCRDRPGTPDAASVLTSRVSASTVAAARHPPLSCPGPGGSRQRSRVTRTTCTDGQTHLELSRCKQK